jgi:hypothetical protein
MNTFSTFWSRRRNRVIAATVGAGLAGVVLVGGVVADANAATTSSSAAAVVPAAATSPAPAPTTDAARLRTAMRGIRALPAAQRPAAFLQLKADVLAGKYGTKAQRDLAAIDAVVASDPAGLRGALLRLAAAHPRHAASGSSIPTPAPTSQPTPSA